MLREAERVETLPGTTAMILEKFRAWAQTASPATRAEGAAALARAYLKARSDERQRRDAAAVLTSFLDDPSPQVRAALADAFAAAPDAPHHIVLTLADDLPEVAAIVLSSSPVLRDAELIDLSATASGPAQCAIASRANLGASVAATLVEVGALETLVVLVRNRTAALSESMIQRIIARHGEDSALREALLGRPGLPIGLRVELVSAGMRALASIVAGTGLSDERSKRIGREARDRAAVALAESTCGWTAAVELVQALREAGHLTLNLVFRAILSGRVELFKAALSVLADVPLTKVDGLVERCDTSGFASLYRKAGLPAELLPAIRIALHAAQEADWTMYRQPGLSCLVVERVLTGCDAINGGELDTLMVLLRRFEAEAAREATRVGPYELARADALLLERDRADTQPLVLRDRAEGVTRLPVAARPLVMVDLVALEAELCAA